MAMSYDNAFVGRWVGRGAPEAPGARGRAGPAARAATQFAICIVHARDTAAETAREWPPLRVLRAPGLGRAAQLFNRPAGDGRARRCHLARNQGPSIVSKRTRS